MERRSPDGSKGRHEVRQTLLVQQDIVTWTPHASEDWMPHRRETEETQEYLDRILREGKVTPEQFYEIVNKINNKD